MKKRTKKKLAKYSGKAVKGLTKLVIVYPLKGAWWVVKESSKGIYQGIKKNKGKRKEQGEKRGKEQKISEKKERSIKGSLKIEPNYDSLKEIKNQQGDFSTFENKLLESKSLIGIILGARGTGKSAIGMRLLENFKAKTRKKIYALGFKAETLPNWIKVVKEVEEIENNAVVLIDEGGIEFSSRKAMSSANKLLSEMLMISRHKDLSVLFISQSSANLEVNALRQSDFLILKPSSLLQLDFERKKIKNIYENAAEDFKELNKDQGLSYVYSGNYAGFVSNTLPTFWSEEVSKGYKGK